MAAELQQHNGASKPQTESEANSKMTSNVRGAVARGSIVGAAAGAFMEIRAGARVSSWKAFPHSMVSGAIAFGSALGIYEATKCKLMQIGVVDDLSTTAIAGTLGTGIGGTLFGAFPWTKPNSMKMYPEKFQQFQKEIPKNFMKYGAIGGVYFAMEYLVLSKYMPKKQD